MMEANKELEEKIATDSTPDILPLEDEESENVSKEQQFLCGICKEKYKQPKVLHCLHSFCTECLEKSLLESGPTQISCQTCRQVTRLTSAGAVNELPIDAVICNLMEMDAICAMTVICTSCKTQENAVARCSDCSNFLCPNCVTAHNYMRCFEKHKVDTFETLKDGKGIHKPMYCQVHPSEPFKFYCKTCQTLTCTECMIYLHKRPDHQCERVVDLEKKQRCDFKEAVADTRGKVASFDSLSTKLEGLLSELQSQRDNACDLIKETFQSFKALLEKRKDEMITELEAVHSEKELAIMDMFNSLEKSGEKMTDTCKFVDRSIEHADAVELLSVSKLIKSRMQAIGEEMPHSELSVKIELEFDGEKFAQATKDYFCSLKKGDKPQIMASSSSAMVLASTCPPPSSTLNLPLSAQLNGSNHSLPNNLMHMSKPQYDSNHQNSHFDGSSLDRFKLLDNQTAAAAAALNMPTDLLNSLTANLPSNPLLNEMASSIATTLTSNPSLQGLNHPINFAERSLSRNSYSPTISDSGVDVSSTANQQSLIQQLLKNGQLGINPQGNLTLNGQPMQGFQSLNWNMGLAGHTSPPNNQTPARVPSLTNENSLAGLLTTNSSMTGVGGGALSQSSTPSIGEISALLNTLNTHNMASGSGTDLPMNGVFPAAGTRDNNTRTRSSGKTNSMEIRTKFGQLGPGKGQFNAPHGFCLGMDEDIVVADTNNHRIQVFEKTGEFKYQFGIPGREEGQLWYPRKVAVIRMSGRYVVCDRGNERSRMQLFTRNGQFIKKIAIRYIDIVAGLAITSQGHIVAVDSVSPTVFCISEVGELIKWFDCSDYMREPSDIAVSGKDYYVCDFKGHCVVVFNEEGHFLHRIGCESVTNYPNGIDISDAGDVLIGDSHGNRFHVAVFQRDGSLIGEFECPYVKVSRCCGLKITSEGYIVTLAKNNQHVLVLNTLYIA